MKQLQLGGVKTSLVYKKISVIKYIYIYEIFLIRNPR